MLKNLRKNIHELVQCCQNHISTWQTLLNLKNGLLLKAFLVKSRPLADQNEHF
jgi:hypothetical protein